MASSDDQFIKDSPSILDQIISSSGTNTLVGSNSKQQSLETSKFQDVGAVRKHQVSNSSKVQSLTVEGLKQRVESSSMDSNQGLLGDVNASKGNVSSNLEGHMGWLNKVPLETIQENQ
ncbi:hypothetical protein O6P43_017176 [Quillaja saponaria]|uniref:Uncharacterized protein n=1 Tax=Quillaja saponaria TaxID=32244 RepID=A0AAD7LPM4_QUISA|nr:hypothetical protein O6P43_017176 [Quillaja saponaria]